MIPILQRGQRIPSTTTNGVKGVGVEEAQAVSTTKHSLVTGVESGFTFRAFALAGSIFMGAIGSIVFWRKGGYGEEVLFHPRAGGQNYSHARTTRLHYNLLYIPPCYGLR